MEGHGCILGDLPHRIVFAVPITPLRRSEIAVALCPLADKGWAVTVEDAAGEARESLWRVRLEAPGDKRMFNIRESATLSEWLAIAQTPPPTPRSA